MSDMKLLGRVPGDLEARQDTTRAPFPLEPDQLSHPNVSPLFLPVTSGPGSLTQTSLILVFRTVGFTVNQIIIEIT